MTTRTITGPLRHPESDTLWASASLSFRLRAPFVSSATYPTETVTVTTDGSGQFSVSLAVPSSGTVLYIVTLPDGRELGLNLSAGAPTTLHALIAIAQTNAPPSTLQVALDALTLTGLADTPDSYAGQAGKVVAVNDDEDGVEFITVESGGAVDSVNAQTGVVVLAAADVGADASGTAAGLVASEASTRAAADTTLSGLISSEASTRSSADATLQSNITAEASARSSADSAHAALTTGAHGGIVASTDPRLSDSRAPSGAAGGVLGGTYPNPGFAVDMATQAELDAAQALDLKIASDLADLHSVPTARTNLGLGTAAVTNTGTGAANTILGNDSRLTDSRTPTTHASSHASAGGDPLTLSESQITNLIADLAAKLAAASNLSDLANAGTARTNLGLGSLAVLSTITASLISDASANGRSLITATNYAAMRTLLSLVPGTDVQAYSAVLLALAGLTNAANKGIVFSGGGAAATFDLSSFALTFLDDANAAAVRTTLGLVIGTDVQAFNANLAALAGLTLAANKLPYATGAGALALADLSTYIRTLLDDADAATARATLGAATAVAEGRAKGAGVTYFAVPGVEATGATTTALAANTIRYETVEVLTAITLDQLVCEISTAGAAATTVRLAIYNADTDWQPASLVVDAGTLAADTLGVKAATISQVLLPGRYLFAINSDGTPSVRVIAGGVRNTGYRTALSGSPYIQSLTVPSIYGAYAGTGVVWTTVTFSSTPLQHAVFCRISVP